jgi:hypothetical protein
MLQGYQEYQPGSSLEVSVELKDSLGTKVAARDIFFSAPRIELRTLHLLGRNSTIRVMSPVILL